MQVSGQLHALSLCLQEKAPGAQRLDDLEKEIISCPKLNQDFSVSAGCVVTVLTEISRLLVWTGAMKSGC
jgi:hypothetical protein